MHEVRTLPPPPINEPVLTYEPGSPERDCLQAKLTEMRSETLTVPCYIGGEAVETGDTVRLAPPHDHRHTLGHVHVGGEPEAKGAIAAALEARHDWARMHWMDRAAIFLKAADLLAGPWRDALNASTMLGQSKNAYQAEIDAACEWIDFLRFNVQFAAQIYENQPVSSPGIWNHVQYRPLEGFVFAVTPFNFTAIQANIAAAPALMGNTVVWKPSLTSAYSAHFVYKLLEAAGLPPGVINMVPGHGADVGDPVIADPNLSGLHFTGSTGTFRHLWKSIGNRIETYRTYPRIVGETGGKDFIVAHASADPVAVATAIVRGSFEYQGQKCSASSRVYLPKSQWAEIRRHVEQQVSEIKMGPVEDFSNYVNAVIDAKSFERITGYIDRAKSDDEVEVVCGGGYSDEEGYFVEPTVLLTTDPHYRTMREEIFGPVVTIYLYDEAEYAETLKLIDETSPYALTGAIFATDRAAARQAMDALYDNAGNFYVNDKPTGAVVGQQPFGGARASGTNDKAGSSLNLLRWVSPRSVKETFVSPQHFMYPTFEG